MCSSEGVHYVYSVVEFSDMLTTWAAYEKVALLQIY